MKRTAGLCLVLVLVAGAAVRQAPMPVPPVPPPHPPTASLAPVPNPDLFAPPPKATQFQNVHIQDFRVQDFDKSLGYVPGSRFQTSEDKRPIQTPGLTVGLPLQ